jgi:uncharacterized Zn-finger protein
MASTRPAMHARDSSGRQVSLLNDEPTLRRNIPHDLSSSGFEDGHDSSPSNSYPFESSPPPTPGLLRSNSYDSRNSNDPNSPLTPSMIEFRRRSSYTTPYPDPSQYDKRLERSSIYGSYPSTRHSPGTAIRPPYAERSNSAYEDDIVGGSTSERSGSNSGKRYPCRYKDSHGCDKSFTTSGHASRHSKIHTAEKAVHCSFQGCQKKFTRADNMKQHLETHYKERSRSANHKSSSSSVARLTLPAGIKKSSATITTTSHARISRPTSGTGWTEQLTVDTRATFAQYPPDVYSSSSTTYSQQSPVTSPKSSYSVLDLHGFQNALPAQLTRPIIPETSNGLDALVAAAACQMGNQNQRFVNHYSYGK